MKCHLETIFYLDLLQYKFCTLDQWSLYKSPYNTTLCFWEKFVYLSKPYVLYIFEPFNLA